MEKAILFPSRGNKATVSACNKELIQTLSLKGDPGHTSTRSMMQIQDAQVPAGAFSHPNTSGWRSTTLSSTSFPSWHYGKLVQATTLHLVHVSYQLLCHSSLAMHPMVTLDKIKVLICQMCDKFAQCI
jgi:hypothetical protein